MKIKHLTLFTHVIEEQKRFYRDVLGFPIQEPDDDLFTIQIGWTKLTFERSIVPHTYHFCILIPSNQLYEAQKWMASKVTLLPTIDEERIAFFETWNAHSFYFLDAAGNIAECIVHHDLQNTAHTAFGMSSFLGVNEIGLPVTDIRVMHQQLMEIAGTDVWKGDWEHFSTHGSPEGKFLLPNYLVKETWFPTEIKITPAPFSATIENKGQLRSLAYEEGQITAIKNL